MDKDTRKITLSNYCSATPSTATTKRTGMKTRTLMIVISSLLLGLTSVRSAEEQKWQTDWSEYGKMLEKYIEKTEAEARINAALGIYKPEVFKPTQVEWQGEIAEIVLPGTTNKFGVTYDLGCITMKMPAISLIVGGDKVDLSGFGLTPKDDGEWKSWANAKVGMRVVFRTTLKGSSVLHGMGPYAGKAFVMTVTDGATMLRSLPPKSEKQK